MKRSEMVRRLAEDLLTMDGFLNYSYGGHEMPTSYTEIAEEVIDYLVKNGMKPPINNEVSESLAKMGEEAWEVFEWEPEDEA